MFGTISGDTADDGRCHPIRYSVCVWDYAGSGPSLVMAMVAPPAGNCQGHPCWRPIGDGRGFRYTDYGLLPNGLRQMTLKSGPLGKPAVLAKARGAVLPDPPMPFLQDPSITVQVVNSLGNCWGADYVSPARVNDTVKLLTKEEP